MEGDFCNLLYVRHKSMGVIVHKIFLSESFGLKGVVPPRRCGTHWLPGVFWGLYFHFVVMKKESKGNFWSSIPSSMSGDRVTVGDETAWALLGWHGASGFAWVLAKHSNPSLARKRHSPSGTSVWYQRGSLWSVFSVQTVMQLFTQTRAIPPRSSESEMHEGFSS